VWFVAAKEITDKAEEAVSAKHMGQFPGAVPLNHTKIELPPAVSTQLTTGALQL